jgi:hypothetical protein
VIGLSSERFVTRTTDYTWHGKQHAVKTLLLRLDAVAFSSLSCMVRSIAEPFLCCLRTLFYDFSGLVTVIVHLAWAVREFMFQETLLDFLYPPPPTHNCFSMYVVRNSSRAMAQAVSRRPLTAAAQVRLQVSPCEICGGLSSTGTDFFPSSSAFPCQYSTVALHTIWRMNNRHADGRSSIDVNNNNITNFYLNIWGMFELLSNTHPLHCRESIDYINLTLLTDT